jgi:antitoxin HicB
MARNVEEYLRLPYKVEVFRETDPDYPGWVARVLDLPGCITQADTFEELEGMIEDAMRSWIETAIERDIPVPEPQVEAEYSGKFVVRVPKSLHRQLVEAADEENVSLNQLINVALAKTVAAPNIAAPTPRAETAKPNLG